LVILAAIPSYTPYALFIPFRFFFPHFLSGRIPLIEGARQWLMSHHVTPRRAKVIFIVENVKIAVLRSLHLLLSSRFVYIKKT